MLVNREVLGEYYKALDVKHFSAEGTGSVFKEVSSPEELLALAVKQRGDLEGDDRVALTKLGADPEAFQDVQTTRYLMVVTKGELGMVRSEDLDLSVQARVAKIKPGCPVTVSVPADVAGTARETNVATVIIGQALAATGLTGEVLYTAHPGVPVPPSSWPEENDPFAHLVGKQVTLSEVLDIAGQHMWIQLHR